MGRHSCCYKQKLRKGLWSPEEDEKLCNHITKFGVGCWSAVPKEAGLQRCGKSCRLRWINYLRPDLKRGSFTQEEENLIIRLHEVMGNRWSQIASQLPGRTDNEIKNLWNSCLKKKLRLQGIDPSTHKPLSETKDQENKNCNVEALQPQSKRLRTMPELGQPEIVNPRYDAFINNNSSDKLTRKPIFSPFPFELQAAIDPIVTNSNLLLQSGQNYRPSDQTQLETNYDFGFSPIPNLSFSDYSNVTDISDSLTTTTTRSPLFLNEAGESCVSINSSNRNNSVEFQMNETIGNVDFAWDAGSKLESPFQFPLNGVKSQELNSCSWKDEQQNIQSSDDYSSIPFPWRSLHEGLTNPNFDIFEQI